ncbi:T9SS type A sorting domain-containing protein [bacterium]|nr:T9SS type A sorting domain-containing protein [bacterium]
MKKMVMTAVMFGMVFAQSPIIRVKQIGEWKTPEYWWKAQETVQLQTFLADDISTPALKNNNFDSWRDDILEIEVTLDDVGQDITSVRFDIAFDNDLITWIENDGTNQETSVNAWSQGNSRVIKGSHISSWTEGDETSNNDTDYSFEVVHYQNVGYTDSIQSNGNETSAVDTSYDWLRITMVSHGVDADSDGTPDFTFGSGNGNQAQILKLKFRINDVADNYEPHSFRIPTYYSGNTGYYTFVSDDYLLDYKVYIDGNFDTAVDNTGNGGARGDISLHPKLVDIEGFGRYIGEKTDTDSDGVDDDTFVQKTYPYWKVVFELDEDNPDVDGDTPFANWYDIEDVADDSNTADEDLSDDVIGDDSGTYYYLKMTDTSGVTSLADQTLPGKGFLGVSYFDYTYTDKNGYYNIQLPRNNTYRVSFWPPDANDDIGQHTQLELDRGAITNINDAIAAFNFQSNKFTNETDINVDSPSAYLIGDVDGDDLFQLNDAYFIWAYTSGVFSTSYTHVNGNTYQQWSSIDNLKANGNAETLNYYQALRGGDTKQRREFTAFWDDDLDQETDVLTQDAGGVIWLNPMMDDVQTGNDTLQVVVLGGTSTFDDPDVTTDGDVNPDYTADDVAVYFTGDMNLSGTRVLETSQGADGYQDAFTGNTYYRWSTHTVQNGDGDSSWNQNCVNATCDDAPSAWTYTNSNNTYDGSSRSMNSTQGVSLSLPDDGSVKVQMGNQVVVPLTITPSVDEITGLPTKVAGFEFEVRYKEEQLQFIDAQTGLLPGPWMTYLNESEIDDEGYKTISFGGLDNSPNNSPQDYYITEEMVGLQLIFNSKLNENNNQEWTEADLQFVGKANAGNPAGDDLFMNRQSGKIRIWNKFWAFGGGQPSEDEMTYVYPNPYNDSEHSSINFQFYMESTGHVMISIYNANGQKVGTILDEVVNDGMHTYTFSDLPDAIGEGGFGGYEELDSGIYLFVMETENKIKSKKFTIIK